MTVIDPGHCYKLKWLDAKGFETINFVKRMGENYPGNNSWYPGTNLQEFLRAGIDRIKYLEGQKSHWVNNIILANFRESIILLEHRAAERHNRILLLDNRFVEDLSTCNCCGHIECNGSCKNLG